MTGIAKLGVWIQWAELSITGELVAVGVVSAVERVSVSVMSGSARLLQRRHRAIVVALATRLPKRLPYLPLHKATNTFNELVVYKEVVVVVAARIVNVRTVLVVWPIFPRVRGLKGQVIE